MERQADADLIPIQLARRSLTDCKNNDLSGYSLNFSDFFALRPVAAHQMRLIVPKPWPQDNRRWGGPVSEAETATNTTTLY